jgi:peptidoglycan hydrolase-like protein with peptidoglycan-binding domain
VIIDGTFGPKTRRTVKKFQRASGLKPDGIVGPKTIAALAVVTP